ncbi:MAG: hypothetical protein AAGJ10_08235 [Bacteroidota bacterium]
MKKYISYLLFCVAFGGAFGCSGPEQVALGEYNRVAWQDSAGTTHFTVLSVAPWHSYVEDLQVQFPISAKAALEQVLPTTNTLSQSILQASGFSAQFGPASVRNSQTVSTDTSSTVTTNSAESAAVPPSLFDSTASGGRTATLNSVGQSLSIDPMLRHMAALALFQEVKLLNRVIEDAAFRYDYHPYIIRLQVGMMPYARNQPYDLYADVSFFNEFSSGIPFDQFDSFQERYSPLGSDGPNNPPDIIDSDSTTSSSALPPLLNPIVLPLLVTDNLEGMLQSRSASQIQQLVLGLGLLNSTFSAGINAREFTERVQAAFGRDLNSLMTVGQSTENSLRIRLGAMLSPASRYNMVPRTHNITLVLLVPKPYTDYMNDNDRAPTIEVISKSKIVDALNGSVPPYMGPQMIDDRYADVLIPYIEHAFIRSRMYEDLHFNIYDDAAAFGEALSLAVQDNDLVGFWEQLEVWSDYIHQEIALHNGLITVDDDGIIYPASSEVEHDELGVRLPAVPVDIMRARSSEIWASISSMMTESLVKKNRFQLPNTGISQPNLPESEKQTILLNDDGKVTTVVISGGRALRSDRISASLKVVSKNETSTQIILKPNSIKASDSGQTLTITFPSLSAWQLPTDREKVSISLSVELTEDSWESSDAEDPQSTSTFSTWIYRKAPASSKAQDPGFKLTVTSAAIVPSRANAGTGQVAVYVKFEGNNNVQIQSPPVSEIKLTVSGADVTKVEGKNVMVDQGTGEISVRSEGRLLLSLSNLQPNKNLVISATSSRKIPHKPISIPVHENVTQK